MTTLHRRLISFIVAVLVVLSARNFIDFDFLYLLFICSVVAFVIGFLSQSGKDSMFNGFWFGFAISLSCAEWLIGLDWTIYSNNILFLFIAAVISFFIGLLGLSVALAGNALRKIKT